MRVSRQKAAENRERIIDAAGALFREKGFDGIGVADIMKAAQLTHGGFYGHFASKDDLVAQASQQAAQDEGPHRSLVAKAHFASDLIQQAEKARILGKNDIARARLAE